METTTRNESTIDYFERPHPFWFAIIIPSLVYLAVLAYMPDLIPFDSLGPLGALSRYLHENHKIIPIVILWMALATHLFEAIYVVKTAHSLQINAKCKSRWFFQTLMLGYPSTRLMNKFYYLNKRK
ncbi:unnamed protein product [Brachionus calyciflorus]|uniref:Transmembrane protein 254 n=1 Tax=Brachionus calyciflorus TaxID=104777 RepID=A0A813VRA0_9BILA|nr:unnamed protein product [Brachionus calyciflorus]